jgi:hypothetical protein
MRSKSDLLQRFWWRRILLSVCALALMVVTIPAVIVFPAEYILFQPQTTLDAVESSGFYQKYPELVLDLIQAGGEVLAPGAVKFVQAYFPADRLTSVIRFIYPEEWVRAQVDRAVSHFWAYYNLEDSRLYIALDFRPIKARLKGNEGKILVAEAFQGLPDCNLQDALTIATLLMQKKTEGLPSCKPPKQVEGVVVGVIQLALEGITDGLPDEKVLVMRFNPVIGRYGPGGIYEQLRFGLRFSLMLMVLLMLGAISLLDYSWRNFLEWAGVPLYSSGLISAGLASLAGVSARWLDNVVSASLPGSSRVIFSFISGIALTIFQNFLAWVAVAAVIVAVLGLGMILFSRMNFYRDQGL